MQSVIYERPALGQKAYLGSLYNARTDSFLVENILDETPEEGIEIIELNRAETVFGTSDTYKERFEKMGIGPELAATILAGSANIQGTGAYVNEQRASFPSVHRALHYSLQTVQETLNLLGSAAHRSIKRSQLERQEATHVVTKIVWGAKCIVSATRRIPTHGDRKDAQKSLEDAFNVIAAGERPDPIRRVFSGQLQSSTDPNDQHLNVRYYSDLEFDGHTGIDSLAKAKDHIIKLPDYLDSTNTGKGIQIAYSLLPIGFISLNFGIPPTIAVAQPSPESLTRLIALLDEAEDVGQSLNDYYAYLNQNELFVSPEHLMKVGNEIRYADLRKATLVNQYSRSLKSIRQGTPGSQEIWELLEAFANGETSPKSLRSLAWMTKKKVDFICAAVAQGTRYVGYNSANVDDFIKDQGTGTLYILYLDTKTMESEPEWGSVPSLFFDLIQQGKCASAVVDCDALEYKITKAIIAHYENGQLLAEDFIQEQQEMAKKNRIFHHGDQPEPIDMTNLPAQRQVVKIPCPYGCDPSTSCIWVCSRCQLTVEYGRLDMYFYCNCGRVRFDATSFKCCDPCHGNDPYAPNGYDLHQSLRSMPPPDELNVLILGETGVGKSTFINAFINYLTYNELDDAMKTPHLNWVIPCAFATQIKTPNANTFTQTKILIGNDVDEHRGLKGASATQQASAYAIHLKDQLVRLIDTPGMGDTRGPEQDRKNMSDVLSVLRSYDYLHGIIILLKPNQPRLTFMFRFIVQELLGHLHRSAANNMVYAFTNTRGTNFAPGDSYGPLQELLLQFKTVLPPLTHDNVYCFDSESFRYIAAKKEAGIDLGEIEDVRRSWIKSSKESQRLLKHFGDLRPHPVTHTVSLNATRYLIESLIAPMREVSKTILRSIAESEKRKRELQETTATGEDLKAKLRIPKSTVEAHQSDQPVTACNHLDCAKKVAKEQTLASHRKHAEGEANKIRKSLCHNPCSLKEIQAYEPGAAGLEGCHAFRKNHGVCRKCKHGWQDHEHILVWYTERTEITDDPKVLSLLLQKVDEAQAKAAALEALSTRIAEFHEEHRMIQEAAAKFTVYMQKNSITVYNDATLAYYRHLIKDEDNRVQMGADDTRLEALKKEREQYKAYVEIISKARERGVPGAVPDEKGISQIAQELYCMKHYGRDLKKVADTLSRAYAATFRETAYHIRPKRYWMRAQGRRTQSSRGNSHRNQSYRSLLDTGPATLKKTPSRRQDTTGSRTASRRRITSSSSQVGPSDTSWQAAYAQSDQVPTPATDEPKTKAYLPFDDEITSIQPRGAHWDPPLPEKHELTSRERESSKPNMQAESPYKLSSSAAIYDAPPPYSSPPTQPAVTDYTNSTAERKARRKSSLMTLVKKAFRK